MTVKGPGVLLLILGLTELTLGLNGHATGLVAAAQAAESGARILKCRDGAGGTTFAQARCPDGETPVEEAGKATSPSSAKSSSASPPAASVPTRSSPPTAAGESTKRHLHGKVLETWSKVKSCPPFRFKGLDGSIIERDISTNVAYYKVRWEEDGAIEEYYISYEVPNGRYAAEDEAVRGGCELQMRIYSEGMSQRH